jgi:hypothetical protein
MLMIPVVARQPRTQNNLIRTYTGLAFWPLDPRPAEVCIEDIAHHLSLECRFTGATYCHYSVADHSLRVSKLAEQMAIKAIGCGQRRIHYAREVALWGLLHDASEAYLKDLPRPLKHSSGIGPIYRGAEEAVMQAVTDRFGLIAPEPAIVKEADDILLNTEKRDLMTGCVERMGLNRMPETIYPLTPQEAETEFLRRFKALTMARNVEWALEAAEL